MPKKMNQVEPRMDVTAVGTPEVAAPTVAEMKAVERETPPAPGVDDVGKTTVELDCEGMAGYRQGDRVLGSEGETK